MGPPFSGFKWSNELACRCAAPTAAAATGDSVSKGSWRRLRPLPLPSPFLLHWCKKCKTKKFYEITVVCERQKETWRCDSSAFGSCLGGGRGTGASPGRKERGSAVLCRLAPVPRRPRGGGGAALLARCFSVNFYGMQKEFFVLFCFFVKLNKKYLHLILEPPYLKKGKKEQKN